MGEGWRQFTDEFKREAVALLSSSGRPLLQIASELGISPSMLRNWRNRSEGRNAGLALSMILAGDNDAALSALDRAIALNPNFALAYRHRALILVYLNHPEEAISSVQQAIRLSPFDPAIAGISRDLPKGVAAEIAAHLAEGLRKAGLPEE